MAKRQVEVFTAGCLVCDPAVQTVKAIACPDCEVTVYNLNLQGAEKARLHDLKTVPCLLGSGGLAFLYTVSVSRRRSTIRDVLSTHAEAGSWSSGATPSRSAPASEASWGIHARISMSWCRQNSSTAL